MVESVNPPEPAPIKSGIEMIQEERQRQIAYGFTPEFDLRWEKRELIRAAENYLQASWQRHQPDGKCPNAKWPWTRGKWKPSVDNRVRELAIAGALYLAEAERRERLGRKAAEARAKVKGISIRIDRAFRHGSVAHPEGRRRDWEGNHGGGGEHGGG